jgi:hypothetical protein
MIIFLPLRCGEARDHNGDWRVKCGKERTSLATHFYGKCHARVLAIRALFCELFEVALVIFLEVYLKARRWRYLANEAVKINWQLPCVLLASAQ